MEKLTNLVQIRVDDCRYAGYRNPGKIETLKESLRTDGPIAPIVAVEHEDHFEVIDGGRRLQAYEELGWRYIIARLVEPHEAERTMMAANVATIVTGIRNGALI